MKKAYDAISMEDLEILMGKPSSELMSSHAHKIMQVCALLKRTFFFNLSHVCRCRCWESPYTSLKSTWTMIRG